MPEFVKRRQRRGTKNKLKDISVVSVCCTNNKLRVHLIFFFFFESCIYSAGIITNLFLWLFQLTPVPFIASLKKEYRDSIVDADNVYIINQVTTETQTAWESFNTALHYMAATEIMFTTQSSYVLYFGSRAWLWHDRRSKRSPCTFITKTKVQRRYGWCRVQTNVDIENKSHIFPLTLPLTGMVQLFQPGCLIPHSTFSTIGKLQRCQARENHRKVWRHESGDGIPNTQSLVQIR